MKANEAPEKIYIHPDIGGREFLRPWLHRPANNESVEYTRTDAFIEKACGSIKHLLSGYVIRNFNFGDSYEMDTLIEDFVKYMKGE